MLKALILLWIVLWSLARVTQGICRRLTWIPGGTEAYQFLIASHERTIADLSPMRALRGLTSLAIAFVGQFVSIVRYWFSKRG